MILDILKVFLIVILFMTLPVLAGYFTFVSLEGDHAGKIFMAGLAAISAFVVQLWVLDDHHEPMPRDWPPTPERPKDWRL